MAFGRSSRSKDRAAVDVMIEAGGVNVSVRRAAPLPDGVEPEQELASARRKATLTGTVAAWSEYLPLFPPLPHPSPRNQPWLKRHPWFERELLPRLRARVRSLLAS